MTSCKSDSKNETAATDTAATANAVAGKDMKDSLILTQAPTFTDQATINFSAEYDSFLSEYRKAVRENNTEATQKLLDKYLDLAKKAAAISEKLNDEERSKFQQFITSRQAEYAEITSGDKF
ncbi:MAG: hypothetical protein HWD63_03775 [Candidatus Parvibacillus calidus]|nr:MAG: hypothetical protein HWD63_03775 [Candidatus Parvibacillus calidus]